MNNLSSKTTLPIFSLLPIILLGIFIAPDFPPLEITETKEVITLSNDTIPSNEIITDTIISFDPATKIETMSFIRRDKDVPSIFDSNAAIYQQIKSVGEPGRIDSVFIFDPETKTESMYIIEH